MVITRNDHIGSSSESGLKHPVICRVRFDLVDRFGGLDDVCEVSHLSTRILGANGFPSEFLNDNANEFGKQWS